LSSKQFANKHKDNTKLLLLKLNVNNMEQFRGIISRVAYAGVAY